MSNMIYSPWFNLVTYVASIVLAGGLGATLTWVRATRKFDYTIRVEKDKRQQIMLTVGTFASTLGAQVPPSKVKEHVEEVVSQITELDRDEPRTESFSLGNGHNGGRHVPFGV